MSKSQCAGSESKLGPMTPGASLEVRVPDLDLRFHSCGGIAAVLDCRVVSVPPAVHSSKAQTMVVEFDLAQEMYWRALTI